MSLFRLTILIVVTAFLVNCSFFGDSRIQLTPFEDIPLPPKLTLDEKNTTVFESPEGRVGLMLAYGKINLEEVTAYYQTNLAETGWNRIGEFFQSERRRLLVFKKEKRSVAVTMNEGWLSTEVEINVSALK
ncbi:MAG: hypothetical protein LBV77_02855 [Candidatus Adiutrix intracellularis]|jgi:hypothetical protein|nr:hypothetical protein [Candidatus Adiutrix intracellularis]